MLYNSSIDNKLYFDITDKAEKLLGIFDLFAVWKRGSSTFRIPMNDEADIRLAKEMGKAICIEVGDEADLASLPMAPKVDWEKAHKIRYNGFIYIKYADIMIYS